MTTTAEALGHRALFERFEVIVGALQAQICAAMEALERELGGTARFGEDVWVRPAGGGGRTRTTQGGVFLEKGGVSFASVHGELDPRFAGQLPGEGLAFAATGVSLVLHPRNPHVPTVHANFRHIQRGARAWFGGGADLTPYYLEPEDVAHFHAVWRGWCEAHAAVADYERWAAWCERYFFLPHRAERRGIGGVFFDDLVVWPDSDAADERQRIQAVIALFEAAGRAFIDSYAPIVRRRAGRPWSAAEREWQCLRRGRYVEFNLLYDRGTAFGLKTGGRTESILMSLPPEAHWNYGHVPAPGTPEAALIEYLGRSPLPVRDERT